MKLEAESQIWKLALRKDKASVKATVYAALKLVSAKDETPRGNVRVQHAA